MKWLASSLIVAALLLGGATCEPAGKVEPTLLIRPRHVNVATVQGEVWQRELLPNAANWWTTQTGLDLIQESHPVDADVAIYWEPGAIGQGYCELDTHPRRISIDPGMTLGVAWQVLLHELGHCVYGLPHHWSRSSIMYPTVPVDDKTFDTTRVWFYVLGGERRALLEAY